MLKIKNYWDILNFENLLVYKKIKINWKLKRKNIKCHQRHQERIPQKPKNQKSQEKRKELSHSQSISTEYWNKFTQKLESQRDPCQSWTHSSTISSKKSQLSHQNSWDTTRSKPSHPEKSKLQLDFFFQENLLNTPFQREPKLLLNIQPTHEYRFYECYYISLK